MSDDLSKPPPSHEASSTAEPGSRDAGTLSQRPVRWKALFHILRGLALCWVWARFWPAASRQHIFYREVVIGLIGLLALLIWLVCSRLPWRRQVVCLIGALAMGGLFCAAFRLKGVDGNLLPVFEARWKKAGAEKLVISPRQGGGHAVAVVPVPEGAADWPQFMGPTRDTRCPGPDLVTDWAAQPPVEIWRRPVGIAWTGFVVAGGLAITQEQRGDEEVTVAYALATGEPVWQHGVKASFVSTIAGDGPRTSPTIHQGRIYTAGSTGWFSCLDVATGQVHWERNILKEAGASVPEWGYSTSPLVLGDHLIVHGVKNAVALMALRLSDGSEVWRAAGTGKGQGSYSSAISATLHGRPQIVFFHEDGIAGHDPATGAQLWRHPWKNPFPHVALPMIVDDDEVIFTMGYAGGGARIRLAPPDTAGKSTVEELWQSVKFRAKFTNMTLIDGHVYGLDDGKFACFQADTGQRLWREGSYGHGQQILIGRTLLVMAEDGRVVLIDPQTSGLKEVASFAALQSQTWNPPTLAGNYLLVRNDKEAACFRVRRK